MLEKIKPCPFCGREPITRLDSDYLSIKCDNCNVALGDFLPMIVTFLDIDKEMQRLISKWNQRV